MLIDPLAPLGVAVAIALVHAFGDFFSEHIRGFHWELLSLGAGLMVGTFFLEILPHVAVGEVYLSHFVYVGFLLGFVAVHVLEKIVYQHAASRSEFARDRVRFEAAGLLAYKLLVGIIIAVFFEAYGGLAYFVVAPLFVRAFALSVYSRHINESLGGRLNRVLQFVGPVVGALVGLVLIGDRTQLFLVFSVTMGCILYVVVRDMIPTGRLGKPSYFVAGAAIALATSLVFQAVQTI